MSTSTATLDRIVDGEHAVLLVEEDGAVVDEFVVDVEEVPAEGRFEGAVFEVEVVDDELEGLEYLDEETAERGEAAQERLDRLSRRLGEEDAGN